MKDTIRFFMSSRRLIHQTIFGFMLTISTLVFGADSSEISNHAVATAHCEDAFQREIDTHTEDIYYTQRYKNEAKKVAEEFAIFKALAPNQYGLRLLLTYGPDPAVPTRIPLPNGRYTVVIGLTAQKAIFTSSLRSLARGGLIRDYSAMDEKSKDLLRNNIDTSKGYSFADHAILFNENGHRFGERKDGNDDAWDLKVGRYQTPDGRFFKKDGSSFYILAGSMDFEEDGDLPNSKFVGYPGEYSANYTRQGRIWQGSWQRANNPLGFQLVGKKPRSLFDFINSKSYKKQNADTLEKIDPWHIKVDGATRFAHSYGFSVTRYGVDDYAFNADGTVEVFWDHVLSTSENANHVEPSPYKTGIARTTLDQKFESPSTISVVATPDNGAQFYRSATRADQSGLLEGLHGIKIYDDGENIRMVRNLEDAKVIQAKGGEIITFGIGSPGQWTSQYGTFTGISRGEGQPFTLNIDSDGDLHNPFAILDKLFTQSGRDMMFMDENNQEYVMRIGTPLWLIKDDQPVRGHFTGPDLRHTMVFPIRWTRKNGQPVPEIIDNTGLLERIKQLVPEVKPK